MFGRNPVGDFGVKNQRFAQLVCHGWEKNGSGKCHGNDGRNYGIQRQGRGSCCSASRQLDFAGPILEGEKLFLMPLIVLQECPFLSAVRVRVGMKIIELNH